MAEHHEQQAAPRTIAPLVKGLSAEGSAQTPPSVMNVIANARWADLQPTAGGPIAPGNVIDKAIAKGFPFVVRLFFGRYSPAWALGLGKVHVYDPTDGVEADVVRWWEADVQAAQKDLVLKLAAQYDGKIPLIYIANGGTIYAEPFIRGLSDSRTQANLKAAGYTADADAASYVAGYEMFRAFKVTRLAQAFNPWQKLDASGKQVSDVAFTISMMDKFAGIFPRRAVWGNNSIRASGLGGLYGQMYDHMKAAHAASGRPLRFQTATKPRVGSYVTTLQWAVAQGAHCVELSPGFADPSSNPFLTPQQAKDLDAALRAN